MSFCSLLERCLGIKLTNPVPISHKLLTKGSWRSLAACSTAACRSASRASHWRCTPTAAAPISPEMRNQTIRPHTDARHFWVSKGLWPLALGEAHPQKCPLAIPHAIRCKRTLANSVDFAKACATLLWGETQTKRKHCRFLCTSAKRLRPMCDIRGTCQGQYPCWYENSHPAQVASVLSSVNEIPIQGRARTSWQRQVWPDPYFAQDGQQVPWRWPHNCRVMPTKSLPKEQPIRPSVRCCLSHGPACGGKQWDWGFVCVADSLLLRTLPIAHE